MHLSDVLILKASQIDRLDISELEKYKKFHSQLEYSILQPRMPHLDFNWALKQFDKALNGTSKNNNKNR